VARDIQAGLETILQAHAHHGLGADAVPGAALLAIREATSAICCW